MKYRIVEDDRNTETIKVGDNLAAAFSAELGDRSVIISDSGQLINWRYVRRLVPIGDSTTPRSEFLSQPRPVIDFEQAQLTWNAPCPRCDKLLIGIPFRDKSWSTSCGHCAGLVMITVDSDG